MGAPARKWYVACSPRIPDKVPAELALLARFDGQLWWEPKNDKRQPIPQIELAELLKSSDFFEGSISPSNPAWSARDRCAPDFAFGFAYVDSQLRLRITKAGYELLRYVTIVENEAGELSSTGETKRILENPAVQELFLKQFLKWQYPSWQHGGNPRTRRLYLPAAEMGIFPFVETLRLAYELDGLTKHEIAMFGLSLLQASAVPEAKAAILEFRQQVANYSGRERREFIRNTHESVFRHVYAEDIAVGNIATRQTVAAPTVEGFLAKKMRNSLDVADAAIRYFRVTGLFTLSAMTRRLTVSHYRRRDVEDILGMEFTPVDFYEDVEAFYDYFGNPELPVLPWETLPRLLTRARTAHTEIEQIALEIRAIEPEKEMEIPALPADLQNLDLTALKTIVQELSMEKAGLRQYLLELESQKPEVVEDILRMFEEIVRKRVIDPALFFEWNTWRALLALDDARQIKPNFTLDDQLLPLHNAPGRKADIEADFRSFVVLVEVTLSGGVRQYDTEAEPVTRHVARYQDEEKKTEGRDVFGMFIAPRINPNTPHYFWVHATLTPVPPFGDYVTIIPLTLQQFVDIVTFCKEHDVFTAQAFLELLSRLSQPKDQVESAEEWVSTFPEIVKSWKESLVS